MPDTSKSTADPVSNPVDFSNQLFESSPDCLKLLDVDGRLLSMNRNGQCVMEIDDFGAICNMPWHSLWPVESHAKIAEAVAAARMGRNGHFEGFCPTAKGQRKWWDVMVAPLFGCNGEVVQLLSVSRDVTALHYAKEEARSTAARLQFVLASAEIGDWDLDLATDTAIRSCRHAQCFGYQEPPAKWGFATFIQHVHPEDRAYVKQQFHASVAEAKDWHFECRVIWPDQSIHWIAVHGAVYRDNDKPGRMGGIVVDITERKLYEEALREKAQLALETARQAELERRRLDALLEAAPVGIGMADKSGRLIASNSANRRIWGEHPLSHDVDAYIEWKGWWADGSDKHGQPIKPHEWGLARALRGEEAPRDLIEIEPFGAPGARRTVLLHAAPIRDERGEVTGSVVAQMDITDQVKAEAALRESEAKFRTITEVMPQMVWSTRPDGYHDYFNQQWHDFTGMPVGATNGDEWNSMFHPDDQQRAWEAWHHSLVTGEPYEIQYRLRHHSGEYRWTLGRALPVVDDTGKIIRWMGTCTDIHDQKLAEEGLKTANRRKDEFLAMLAHELRNPLAPISTAAQLLKIAGKDEERVHQYSDIITRQVKHMTELVDDLLDVSRVTRGLADMQRDEVDLKSVVSNAIEQAWPLIEARKHHLITRVHSASAFVIGDRTRLVQVLANLLNNAAKYTPPGGEIAITMDVQDTEARISVTDNGMGIEPSLLPHVFDLFTQAERTPDRSQGGLGLGLALVKSIMMLHGGRVEAHSPGVGSGSTFSVILPLVKQDESRQREMKTERTASAPGRPVRLFIVDDNIDAAQSLAALLETKGHHVRVLEDAQSTLREASRKPAQVFILDIGLPDIDGYELARRLRKNPDTAHATMIALTGYGQAHDRTLSKAAGFDHHFVKPINIEKLAEILAQVS